MPVTVVDALERRARVGREFILAGDARFTIEKPDGSHRTYRVKYREANGNFKETWFVSLLTGSDNDADGSYTYIGVLDDFTGQVRVTKASPYPLNDGPVFLLNRVLARIWADDHETVERAGYRVHHEGRCGRCGHVLTVPESIERGIGPECWSKMHGDDAPSVPASRKETWFDDAPKTAVYESSDPDCPPISQLHAERDNDGDVTCWRGRVNGREVVVFND
jgi:hypothetical protein